MCGSRTRAVLALAFPTLLLLGCSDGPAPTEATRAIIPTTALGNHGARHGGVLIGHDTCDPATFNAVVGPGTCVKPGPTTFAAFIAELEETQDVKTWKFNPPNATAHEGRDLLVHNVGGEVHTFTPVNAFGGGFIPDLNTLSGNPVPAPECLNFGTLEFVPAGGKSVITGAALAAVAGSDGIARVECCIHPWMRAEVRLK